MVNLRKLKFDIRIGGKIDESGIGLFILCTDGEKTYEITQDSNAWWEMAMKEVLPGQMLSRYMFIPEECGEAFIGALRAAVNDPLNHKVIIPWKTG